MSARFGRALLSFSNRRYASCSFEAGSQRFMPRARCGYRATGGYPEPSALLIESIFQPHPGSVIVRNYSIGVPLRAAEENGNH